MIRTMYGAKSQEKKIRGLRPPSNRLNQIRFILHLSITNLVGLIRTSCDFTEDIDIPTSNFPFIFVAILVKKYIEIL